jgi:hypothetical protein
MIFWTKAELGTFAPYGASKIVDSGDGRVAVRVDDEILMQQAHRREMDKRRKRKSEKKANFRHLWSWLRDEGGGSAGKISRGEKLAVILGLCSSSEIRTKRSCQLERDGGTIIEALEMLKKDPLKVRRTANQSRSPAVQLAALSLKMQDQQDEEKVIYEKKIREKLEKARVKIAETEAEVQLLEMELEHLTGERRPAETGKKKRP